MFKSSPNHASIIIEEHSEKILYSRSANQLRHPASMTKVMTLYIIFEEIQKGNLSNNSRIEFSKRASGQPPSKLGIKQGRSISLREAMLALVTKSANDVATAVAEKIAGTEINFAKRMTKKAKSLGMNNTRFMNASGLYNKYQKSTALDMAKLGIAIKRNFPLRYKIFNTKTNLSFKIVGQSILSGFLGMALGMSLLLIALKYADAGIVATLSSTSPIMILFLIWLLTKKIPTIGAWIGTVLAIIGSGLIFIY